jgi:membrane-bound lytic murein transglycosylase MltF
VTNSAIKPKTSLWLSVCLAATVSAACANKEVSPYAAASPTVTRDSVLPMPFGRHTDDLDGMLQRRNIRALVMINPIGFFYQDGQPMGAIYETLRDFQTFINKKFKTGALKVEVTFIPVRPDQAEIALTKGIGDFIANAVVITPKRQQRFAFTAPIESNVEQIIVTGTKSAAVSSLEDLGGKQIYVNPLAANFENLREFNQKLVKAGKPAIVIKSADRNLLDDDLVQMVNAGLIPATATTASRAKLWSEVLPHLTIHSDVVIARGEQTAMVMRKDNPRLKLLLDEFIAPRRGGTSFGNTLLRRYLQSTKWVRNSTEAVEMKKFNALRALFEKYGKEYDFDYLMLIAVGYQESLLDQNKRNPSGAVGIMQVIPKYAAAPPINIPNVMTAGPNIQAGVKILRNIENQYFSDPEIDRLNKTLLSFASYNAGPVRIAELRARARTEGLDPNAWFDNVELMVAKSIGRETVIYVGNVYKYYVAYKLAAQEGKL